MINLGEDVPFMPAKAVIYLDPIVLIYKKKELNSKYLSELESLPSAMAAPQKQDDSVGFKKKINRLPW